MAAVNHQLVEAFLNTQPTHQATENQLKGVLAGKNWKKVIDAMLKNGKLVLNARTGIYSLGAAVPATPASPAVVSAATPVPAAPTIPAPPTLNTDLPSTVTKTPAGFVEITKSNADTISNTVSRHSAYEYAIKVAPFVFGCTVPSADYSLTLEMILARLVVIDRIDGTSIPQGLGTGGFQMLAESILNERTELGLSLEDLIATRSPIPNDLFERISKRHSLTPGGNPKIIFSAISKYIARTAFYVYGYSNGYPIYDSVLRDHLKDYIPGINVESLISKCDYDGYCRAINSYLAGINATLSPASQITNLEFDQIVWFSYKAPNAKPKYR